MGPFYQESTAWAKWVGRGAVQPQDVNHFPIRSPRQSEPAPCHSLGEATRLPRRRRGEHYVPGQLKAGGNGNRFLKRIRGGYRLPLRLPCFLFERDAYHPPRARFGLLPHDGWFTKSCPNNNK